MSKTPRHVMLVVLAVAVLATVLLTMLLLAAANYPVQWRTELNAERRRYLEVIAQAVEYYALDRGVLDLDIPSEPAMIANRSECAVRCPALDRDLPCYNLEAALVPGYLRQLPQEPLEPSDYSTGFYIVRDGAGITLGACHVFFNKDITVHPAIVPL
ncbi:MAG: hypothetical protein A3B31_02570 [Candidatus Komeilibacteria bacterium RIFCSPLOWO2_01_FULL_53_11]|uniref:Type II secretion system protein GspG C-terminal domain-containing protein n=1 Tax=Candidatus Komeilibacteria bacterium RIFCSPLOWO2_01_FULL_53_11 TaxID=1798552 RepID=A0A1G2BNJ6_9BACT|nr:MAG: hypothetical protein A3B31_02570 [Candidatus Komeilibacteria bacterium RIFCSPLOWO2_01_FULL_53_11]